MHILYICRAFDNVAGGIEYSSTILMNEMVRRGHRVSLITWDRENARAFFPMDAKIDWRKMNLGDPWAKASWKLRLRRLFRMRQLIRNLRPDVMIGFQDDCYFLAALANLGLGIPVIAAERNSPSRFAFQKSRFPIFLKFILAQKIIVQFESYRKKFPPFLRGRIKAIHNPVFYETIAPVDLQAQKAPFVLLSVGRLSRQKNFAVLIEAFAKIANEHPDWILHIVGEGEEQPLLKDLILRLKIENRCMLLGTRQDVHALYAGASLFCLPSLWEGFPNALAEAMAYGLPCVGFKSCDGVRDLLQNEENGWLAATTDSENLAITLNAAMNAPVQRQILGRAGRKTVERYNPQTIFTTWENTFLEMARQ